MAKTALVVSGGGSKGAFAVGAIEVLLEHGVHFDLITGTSTGALIAPLVATNDVPLLHQIYTQIRTDDVLVPRSGIETLSRDAIYDTHPLWNAIDQCMDAARYQRLLASALDVFLCTVDLQDGEAHYCNPKHGQNGAPLSRDAFNRTVLASCSEPVLMPAVRLPDEHGDQFVDGGVRHVVPVTKAIDEGAEVVYAIVLTPEVRAPSTEAYRFIVDTLRRSLDIFLQVNVQSDLAGAAQTNELLAYLRTLRERAAALLPAAQLDALFAPTSSGIVELLAKRAIDLRVIRPEAELQTESLEFDPAKMQVMLTQGRAAAERLFLS